MGRLIDADKLRKDVLDMPNCYNGFSDTYDKSAIIGMIDEQPTVKTTNHGRWIKVEDDYNNHLYECSYCHTWTSLPTEEVNDGNIRYCWSCGAKMD